MTIQEAGQKARAIWGEYRLISVRLRQDGGADVNLLQSGNASDVSGVNYSAHRLDTHGHPICHVVCGQLDDQ